MAGISLSDDFADPSQEDDGDFGDDEEEEDEEEEDESISDSEIDDFAILAGIDFDDDDESISDSEIDDFAAIAGISLSDDDEVGETDWEDEGDGDDEEYDNSDADQPDVSDRDITQADIVATASTKKAAIAAYADMCVSGSVVRHQANVSGITFYSASGSDDILFDPIHGDPDLTSKEVIISTSSVDGDDTVAAHYLVCSSDDCGTHIISSNEDIAHCPACASDLQEPTSESDSEDDEDFDFGTVVDQEGDEDESEGDDVDEDDSNEQALSRALSFLAGEKDVTSDYLDVSYCGLVNGEKSWVAFYNGQPVAKSTSKTAEKHKAIYEEPAYANAVVSGAQHLGVSKILDEMGFEAITSSVAVSNSLKTVVNKRFKEQVASLASKYETEKQEANEAYRDKLVAALATAAIGINRGFFKGYNNPVKAALQSTLSAAGVRQSESLLDDVFKSHADDYHKALFEKALEIAAKPTEIQNEIAIAVSESNYMSDGNKSQSQVENRLQNIGQDKVAKPTNVVDLKSQSSGSVDVSKIKSVVAGLGRR